MNVPRSAAPPSSAADLGLTTACRIRYDHERSTAAVGAVTGSEVRVTVAGSGADEIADEVVQILRSPDRDAPPDALS